MEELERFDAEVELQLHKEFHDVLPLFKYGVELERRFYLANQVDIQPKELNGSVYFDVRLKDAWVWDVYRPSRFLQEVQVLTFRDVYVERLEDAEINF